MEKFKLNPLWDIIILEAVEIKQSSLILPEENASGKTKSGRFNFKAVACGPEVKTIKPGDYILNGMPIGACIFDGKQVYCVREKDVIIQAEPYVFEQRGDA